MSERNTAASPPRITSLGTALDDELEIQRRSHPLNLGFPEWEKFTRPGSGIFSVLGGRPGQFKTTWAWTMAVSLALAGKRVCWIGLEMRPGQMAAMLVSRLARIPRKRLEDAWRPGGSLTSAESRLVEDARDQMSLMRITFHDPARNEVIDVIETARKVTYDAVFVDHLGLVGAGRGDEFERLNGAITALRRLAHGELAPGYYPMVIALSQLNREIEKHDGKSPRYPRMADLRGSGRLEADADAITILHRPGSMDPDDKSLDLRAVIVKNRQGPFPVALKLRPDPEFCLVEEEPKEKLYAAPAIHYSQQGEA